MEWLNDLVGGVLYEPEIDDREDAVEDDDVSELSVVVELQSSSTVVLLRSLVLFDAVGGVAG